jgi:hypothetical protein
VKIDVGAKRKCAVVKGEHDGFIYWRSSWQLGEQDAHAAITLREAHARSRDRRSGEEEVASVHQSSDVCE